MVMIGVDPHKRSHTAVAVDGREEVLAELLVGTSVRQVPELVAWADRLDGERIWAVESAGGLGYLLSQQLLAAGEVVLDVPATLASRVRVLGSGRSDKNDPNDARSVAIAALRSPGLAPVRAEDHATVLRLLSRRHTQLGWTRNKACCRLHALLCDLAPGGIGKELVVGQAAALLEGLTVDTAAAAERHRIAGELVGDIARLDIQIKASKTRIRAAVAVSGTTLTDIFGVGDILAAIVIGHTGDPLRFATADRYAAYNGTAPVEWSSGNPRRPTHRLSRRGNRALNHALHIAAVTQIRFHHSPGRAFYDHKLAQGHTPKDAIRALKRRISNVVYRHLVADARRARTA